MTACIADKMGRVKERNKYCVRALHVWSIRMLHIHHQKIHFIDYKSDINHKRDINQTVSAETQI